MTRLLIGLLVLCCWACTASASSSTDELAPQRARSTALYNETFGADAPAWEKVPEAFRLWSDLAKAGDAEAKYYLSGVYFRGIPNLVTADSDVALALIEDAADSGLAEAQFALAWQLETGAHVKANPSEALRRYEQAADNGFALAISRLIRIYSGGELGQAVSEEKADVWRDQQRRCCSTGHCRKHPLRVDRAFGCDCLRPKADCRRYRSGPDSAPHTTADLWLSG